MRKKWLLSLWGLIVFLQIIQMAFLHLRNPEKLPIGDIFFTSVTSLIIGSLLIIYFIFPIFDFTTNRLTNWRIPVMVITGFVYSLVYILLIFLVPTIKKQMPFDWYMDNVEKFIIFDFHNTFKNYLFLSTALFAIDYFKKETLWLTNKKNLEIELNQSKLSALKNQLQPHFLFNSLNGIVATIDESKSKAQKMLIGLSEILRTTLNTNFRKLNTLAEEKEFLLKYLNIEKMRYEDQLQFEFNLSDKAMQLRLPALILQPLVENAIKHGFKGNSQLNLNIEALFDQKVVRIKNNGAKLSSEQREGTGLNQVKQRLKLLLEGTSLRIYQEGEWVISEIQLV